MMTGRDRLPWRFSVAFVCHVAHGHGMTNEPSAKQDLVDGLTLLVRAARTTAKKIDIGAIDHTLDRAFDRASAVAIVTARVVSAGTEMAGRIVNAGLETLRKTSSKGQDAAGTTTDTATDSDTGSGTSN